MILNLKSRTKIGDYMNTSIIIAKELEPILKPLYQEMISSVKCLPGKKDTFAVQWGENYPISKKEGIIFVGRATNQWHTTEEDIDILFGNPDRGSTIFNCEDQMRWVYECWDGKDYATKRSAFWRVIRAVSKFFYPNDELSHVAWSNVCKIQMDNGKNPAGKIFDYQIEICKKIFKAEIDVLSPRFVVMFIGDYGKKEMLSYMNHGTMPKVEYSKRWDGYETHVYIIDEVYYICTEHPMGKNESEHIKCLLFLINKYKSECMDM